MEVLYKKVFNDYETVFHKPHCEVNLKDRLKNKLVDSNESPLIKQITIKTQGLTNRGGGNWYHDEKKTDEKTLKNNYNNLLCSINSRRCIIVVEKNEKKIAIKIFRNHFNRVVGQKFFRKETQLTFLTYRYDDGALFYGEMFNYHKKRKFHKSVRRFTFGCRDIIEDFTKDIRRYFQIYGNILTLSESYKDAMDTFICDVIKNNGDIVNRPAKEFFYKSFLNKNGIKYSNNFMVFSDLNYTRLLKKDFIKYNFKLIDVIMSKYGFSGKKIKRILHKVNSFNSETYLWALQFFGEKFVNSQDDYILKLMFENRLILNQSPIEFSTTEKNNTFEIFKLVLFGSIDTYTFNDHIRFYHFLNEFEKIRWNSTDYESFNDEHYQLSEKFNSYIQGNFNRGYNQYFIHDVEHVILGKEHAYTPKVLIDSKDYFEESSYQSNCVRTYIKQPSSLIISLRRSDGDRATIEYEINSSDGKNFNLKRTQTLGRFNDDLDDSWNRPISLLDERVYFLNDSGMFDEITIRSNNPHNNIESNIQIVDDWKGKDLGQRDLKPINRYRLKWRDDRIDKLNRGFGLVNTPNPIEFELDEEF